ncbi:MAG: wax ester/triacylglycerol synthase family O-acyltransferase [Nocardiaceae bacterium]|nr:wax ester/triacylglycerol synthase family O-acyltransferase [Nocardiaceae bacterium]
MKRLSSLDTQFLAAEGANFGSQYCGLLMFDTTKHPIDKDVLVARLENVVRTCPPMRWKVVEVPFGLDYPVFVETAVDLEHHVTESTLDRADDRGLAVEAGQILATKLDRSRPLWRLHVFHGIPGRTAVVFTLHHAVADGISATKILGALVDRAQPLASAPAVIGEVHASRTELALSGLATLPMRWLRAVRATPHMLGHLDLVPALRALPGVHTVARRWRGGDDFPRLDAPRTRFTTKLSARRSVAFGTLPLDVIKAVKNEYGFTVNDVVIALCAGALRHRLSATGDLPDTPLVAYIPISTRAPEAYGDFGNSIGSIIAPLPTHLPDLKSRLEFSHHAMKAAKHRTHQASPTLLADVNDPIPSPIFGIAARGLMDLISSRLDTPPVNLVVSNVAGPPVQLTLAGAPLIATFPLSVVFDSFALNITVVSYQGGLDIGIVGDSVALPDGWDLIEDFHREIADLAALVATSERTPK